jgi:CheY-like chemotaxis protein
LGLLLRIVFVSPYALQAYRCCPGDGRSTEGKMKILIVEDYAPLAESVQMWLEGKGHTVEVAVNGRDGLAQFSFSQDFDVVLTDWNMPIMTGPELVREILLLQPKARIVMWSGNSSNQPPAGIRMLMKGSVSLKDLLTALYEAVNQ